MPHYTLRVAVVLVVVAAALQAQDLPPEVLLLARVRARVRQAVEGLPDCACLESIDRLHKPPGGRELRPVDTVRLDILFSGGRELFASPGDTHWETSFYRFVSSGMIGNGLFALHLKSVFLNNQALITWHGEEIQDGRRRARYDYRMSLAMSGYVLERGAVSETVAEKGSFWADPDTQDLVRLEIFADEIPPSLDYAEVSTAISYARVRIGERDVLLPAGADVRTRDLNGDENLNRIAFTNCRAYHAESSLSFAAPPAEASAPSAGPEKTEGAFPAGGEVTITLTTPIRANSAVGARVEGAVTASGGIRLSAGSVAHGVIRRLEHHSDLGGYYIVGLAFTEIETPSSRLRLSGDLLSVEGAAGVEMTLTDTVIQTTGARNRLATAQRQMTRVTTSDVPGVGTFFARGGRLNLPAGLRMRWKTR